METGSLMRQEVQRLGEELAERLFPPPSCREHTPVTERCVSSVGTVDNQFLKTQSLPTLQH